MNESIQHIVPSELKDHPENEGVYGNGEGEEESVRGLSKSMERSGFQGYIVINKDSVILSGHLRRRAAVKLGLPTIPCVVKHFDDPLDETEFLLDQNTGRPKTTYQLTREGLKRKEIEAERAKAYRLSRLRHSKSVDRTNLSYRQKTGKASDLAAQKVGLGFTTFKSATKVVEAIDQLEEEGKSAQANQLKEKLNKSVHGALKEAKKMDLVKKKGVDKSADKARKRREKASKLKSKGLTKEQIAEKVGVDKRTVSRYLKEQKARRNKNTGYQLIVSDVSDFLNVNVKKLIHNSGINFVFLCDADDASIEQLTHKLLLRWGMQWQHQAPFVDEGGAMRLAVFLNLSPIRKFCFEGPHKAVFQSFRDLLSFVDYSINADHKALNKREVDDEAWASEDFSKNPRQKAKK